MGILNTIGNLGSAVAGRVGSLWRGKFTRLCYFEEVLPIELAAINKRRGKRANVAPLCKSEAPDSVGRKARASSTPRSPDPNRLFVDVRRAMRNRPVVRRQARPPDGLDLTRPQPVPCTATGLALSGGGIRSAAVCLGALQGLETHGRLKAIDYLSTVSGGGYVGASLSAAMSVRPDFPFGTDVFDNQAMAHLRNYSNYLLPRGRSSIRNYGEAAAVILRGLLANGIVVLSAILFWVLVTLVAFRDCGSISGSFLPSLLNRIPPPWIPIKGWIAGPFGATLLLLGLLAMVLIAWAVLRSRSHWGRETGD